MPDGKVQVGVEYKDQKPYRIHSVTVSASQKSSREPSMAALREDMIENVIRPVFKDQEIRPDAQSRLFVNPDGPIVTGGPSTHSGLTGRKNAVDTYGEYSRQSGDALSGKGPLRIDRIGAYAARYAAKNIVASGLARECEVALSYSIGISGPVSLHVETNGTGSISDSRLLDLVGKIFDFRFVSIMRDFDLRHLPAKNSGGFYQKLASYGHVGRSDMDLPWERTDRVDQLRGEAG